MERTYRQHRYEIDEKTFNADAYKDDRGGVAWFILGWELVADQDTEWTGQYNRTGQVLAVMVGDDRVFTFDPDDLKPVCSEEYCSGCGQIGCAADIRA